MLTTPRSTTPIDLISRAEEAINDDIERLVQFSTKHCLKINTQKAAVIFLGNNNEFVYGNVNTFAEENLRYIDLLSIPRHRLTLFRRSFVYSAVSLYNSIPTDMKVLFVSLFNVKYKFFLTNQ